MTSATTDFRSLCVYLLACRRAKMFAWMKAYACMEPFGYVGV